MGITFIVPVPVIHSRRRRRGTSQVQSHAQERALGVERRAFRLVVDAFTNEEKQ